MVNIKERTISTLKTAPVFGWLILLSIASIVFGARLDSRNRSQSNLSKVSSINSNWGGRLNQMAPQMDAKINYASSEVINMADEQVVARNVKINKSKVQANLKMDSRRKGMVYFPTFVTEFSGEYEVMNESEKEVKASINFPLPSEGNLVWDVSLTADGKSDGSDIKSGEANWNGVMKAGEKRTVVVKYMARGQQDFAYSLAKSRGLQDFELKVNVDGAEQIDFPQGSLSPVSSQIDKENKKWSLIWKFDKVLTSPEITIRTYAKQNISATLSKLFYFAPIVMWMLVATIIGLGVHLKRKVEGFDLWLITTLYFSFYPLLAYIASVFENLNLYQGLIISGGLISIIMVMLYQFWWGWGNTLRTGLMVQLMFVFFFPVAILTPEITGLLSVLGVIAILAAIVMMRIRKAN